MDPITLALLGISGFSALGGLGISASANQSSKELNEENLKFQKEQWEYNKKLQERIFQREDSAVQRASQDLSAAGLSKTLAAGSGAGTGAIVAQTAPQNDISSTIAPQLEMAKIQQSLMSEAVNTALQINQFQHQVEMDKQNQNREDAKLGLTATIESWKIGMSEKQFEQTLKEFEHAKTYKQFEQVMQEKYYELDKSNSDWSSKLQEQTYEEMKRWLEFGDDEEHRKLPSEIKMWMWQYNKTHSWENLKWDLANGGINTAMNILENWLSPGGFGRGKMPTPSDRPFSFRKR